MPRAGSVRHLLRRPSAAAAALVVAVAASALVARFPAAVRALDGRAAQNAAQTPLERLIAGADRLDIDNPFLANALAIVPENAHYAVLRPASVEEAQQRGVVPTTYNAILGYVQFLLLPRRQVSPKDEPPWILCYACDVDRLRTYAEVVWTGSDGLAIARRRT